MTILYTDPLFLKHDTGPGHPERADRLRSISGMLEKTSLAKLCSKGEYKPLAEETVAKVHEAKLVSAVKQIAEHGGRRIEADTVVGSESFTVALAAAGTCVAAVDAVVKGKDHNALCLIRPPGHHATKKASMGFCLFNNIALAVRHAKTAHGLDRILIVDWDVHHGNGTQDIFYEDPSVVFFSIHRYGRGFYPGTGAASETGHGPGLGHIFNAPIRFGTTRNDYHERFGTVLAKAADKIKPELVLISAGFDAHAQDPIGSLGLETEDFTALTRAVLAVAKTHAKGRIVSCLEGGYHLGALADSVQTHLEELLAYKP